MSFSKILASLPPIYLLPTHLTPDEQYEIEDQVAELSGTFTFDAKEARLFLGRVSQKKRANFDLRARGIFTQEIGIGDDREPLSKRRKISKAGVADVKDGTTSGSQTTQEVSNALDDAVVTETSLLSSVVSQGNHDSGQTLKYFQDRVVVIRLEWLEEVRTQQKLVDFQPYLVYRAQLAPKPEGEKTPDDFTSAQLGSSPSFPAKRTPSGPAFPSPQSPTTILSRAQAEASSLTDKGYLSTHQHKRRFNQTSTPALTHPNKPPKLHRMSTSEFENVDSADIPDPPHWVRDNNIYSCCRSTRANPPNAPFLDQLYKIKEARLLTLDEIGVRAYSTSIASIAAYPHVLKSSSEVLRLPGCEQKVASLFAEWFASAESDAERTIESVRTIEHDEDLKHLKLFFDIWGVGAETARKFYFDRGWKDIDDVVEFGWSTLNRVQQIGVKFYEEFLITIPRDEVEAISDTILKHARMCRNIKQDQYGTDEDIVAVIVGGYRRGKTACGDVDLILSHRQEEYTKDLVVDVVASLETEGWITHTLTLHTTTSDRGQQTLPFRGEGHGHGFDSLDKALCVWQDPNFDNTVDGKNPNLHRRVDIIVSAWRTVGCAVLGWSGATTFQRDIRRWAKREKGWKFDSSGVRDRASGMVYDLESPKLKGAGDTWLDREKRLMDGMGIGWRDPTERCTG